MQVNCLLGNIKSYFAIFIKSELTWQFSVKHTGSIHQERVDVQFSVKRTGSIHQSGQHHTFMPFTLVRILQTPHWNAIHSGHGPGQKDKASGLLVLVATKLCRPDQIVWREVEAGRLVHCRLHLHPRSFDIIGVYQHTWSTAVVQKTRRKQLWSSIGNLLKEIPNRNSMCILGDFNCSLPNGPIHSS